MYDGRDHVSELIAPARLEDYVGTLLKLPDDAILENSGQTWALCWRIAVIFLSSGVNANFLQNTREVECRSAVIVLFLQRASELQAGLAPYVPVVVHDFCGPCQHVP